MRTTVLIALFALPLFASSCAAVLGIGAGVVISQDMLDDNTYVAQIDEDIDIVWAVSKASLAGQSKMPLHVNEDVRGAVAEIDGAQVTVSVAAYDLNRSRLVVSAKKYGVSNGELAGLVFNRIMENFKK